MKMLEKWKKRKELDKAFQAFKAGSIKRDDLTAEQHRYIQDRFSRQIKRTRARMRIEGKISMAMLDVFVKPFNYPKKPLPVSWSTDFGDEVYYPHCPACGEPAYQKTHCVFCGRRFIWEDQ